MTNLEHAIKHIKTRADAWAVKVIEEALSQEPTEKPMTVDEMEREYEKSKALFHKIVECDDAISREAINSSQKYRYTCGDISITCVSLASINALPPITQKSGKWIRIPLLTCDRCHKINKSGEETDYCPNCGAKMESEDKE